MEEQDLLEQWECQDLMAVLEHLVRMEELVQQVLWVLLDFQEILVHQEVQEYQEQLELLVHLELQAW